MTATLLQFRRPSPALDPRSGSWVVAVTHRDDQKLDKPELITQGTWEHCFALAAIDGLFHHQTGRWLHVMPVSEFEKMTRPAPRGSGAGA